MVDPVATPTVDKQRYVDISMVEDILASYSAETRKDALLAIWASSRKVFGWIVYSSPDTTYCDIICEGCFDITFAASTDYFIVTDIRGAEPPATERSGGFLVLRGDEALGVKLRVTQGRLVQHLLGLECLEPMGHACLDFRERVPSLTDTIRDAWRNALVDVAIQQPSPFVYSISEGDHEHVVFFPLFDHAQPSSTRCVDPPAQEFHPASITWSGSIGARNDRFGSSLESGFTVTFGAHRQGTAYFGGGPRRDHDRMDRLATAWADESGRSMGVEGTSIILRGTQIGTRLVGAMTGVAHDTERRVSPRVGSVADASEAILLFLRELIHHVEGRMDDTDRPVAAGMDGCAALPDDTWRQHDEGGEDPSDWTPDPRTGIAGRTRHGLGDEGTGPESGMRMHVARLPGCVRPSDVAAIHRLPQSIDESRSVPATA